jgi:hypothetical protein
MACSAMMRRETEKAGYTLSQRPVMVAIVMRVVSVTVRLKIL